MWQAVGNFLRTQEAGRILLLLRILFFALYAAASVLVVLSRPGFARKKNGSVPFTAILVCALFALVFVSQAKWQLFGAGNADLMRFMRRHNTRSSIHFSRGMILDRNGTVLAKDVFSKSAKATRHYPLGDAACHLVGYCDPVYGMTGMEKAADAALSRLDKTPIGELGRQTGSILGDKSASGGDAKISIDARLQRRAAMELGFRRGAIVVMDSSTGEILAAASSPGFNPNSPGMNCEKGDSPFFNRAFSGKYPPGSTFKVAMALFAVDSSVNPVLDCPGEGFSAEKGARPIRDHEYYSEKKQGRQWRGFGKIGMEEGLVHSSNVYFAKLAARLDAAGMAEFLGKMDIGKESLLYGQEGGRMVSSAGNVPPGFGNDMKSFCQMAIGQGALLLTPLDVAKITSVVASGGIYREPRLECSAQEGKYKSQRVVSAKTAREVEKMMRECVRRGTGRGIDIPGYEICGKTGTAQNPLGQDHSWFTCFAGGSSEVRPVVTVLVENGGFGSRAALPVAKKMIEEMARCGILGKRSQR